jgi:Bifunctional DNA primase/polymerase, N-terminal/AAA domain
MTEGRTKAAPNHHQTAKTVPQEIRKEQDQKQSVGVPHRSNALDRVGSFIERGWVPIPIRPESKVPLAKWGEIKAATLDVALSWAQWPNADIGVLCGPSNLCVVDIDPRNGGTRPNGLPETLSARTPNDGLHLYFRGQTRSGKLTTGVDVKSARSLVVAPSLNGDRSWVDSTAKVVDVPQWLVDKMGEPSDSEGFPIDVELPPDGHIDPYASTALYSEQERLSSAANGKRNDTLNLCAFKLGQLACQGRIAVNVIERELELTARLIGLDDAEILPTIWSGINGGLRNPRAQGPESESDGTWGRVDLAAILTGTRKVVEPVVLARNDGVRLLYGRQINDFHGEPESLKSFLAAFAAKQVMDNGGMVACIDFEGDDETWADRLLTIGASAEQIVEQFDYRCPSTDPDKTADDKHELERLIDSGYSLVIIDGVTEAMSVYKVKGRSEEETPDFYARLPKRFAKKGAYVLLIDHVTKDADTRGRWAIGSEHKLAVIKGASYLFEIVSPAGRGLRGETRIWAVKDTHGYVRRHSGPPRKKDRAQHTAMFVLDARLNRAIASLEAATGLIVDGSTITIRESLDDRPIEVMDKVSRWVEKNPGRSGRQAEDAIGGHADTIRRARSILEEEGYIRNDGSEYRAKWMPVRRYRKEADR